MPKTIIIDTSVLSQFFRKSGPSKSLQDWQQSVLVDNLLISTITIYEMTVGLSRLADPDKMLRNFYDFVEESGIVEVPVDGMIAKRAGFKKADLMKHGRIIPIQDLLIGSTAVSFMNAGVCIATANVKDFDVWDIEIVNPIA